MADLDEIFSGLAALLREALPADEGQVSACLLEKPQTPALQVAGVDAEGRQVISFGTPPTIEWTILIEAWLGTGLSQAAQRTLRRFLSAGGVADAIESEADIAAPGALFSRIDDDGVVTTGHAAAAQSVSFLAYRGQSIVQTDDGKRALVATWAVQVIA